jgi:hypothetical protein
MQSECRQLHRGQKTCLVERMLGHPKEDPLQAELFQRLGTRILESVYQPLDRRLFVLFDSGVMFFLGRPSFTGRQRLMTMTTFSLNWDGRGAILKGPLAETIRFANARRKEKVRATLSTWRGDPTLSESVQEMNKFLGAQMGAAWVWEVEEVKSAVAFPCRWYVSYWPRFSRQQMQGLGESIQNGLDNVANFLMMAYAKIVPPGPEP